MACKTAVSKSSLGALYSGSNNFYDSEIMRYVDGEIIFLSCLQFVRVYPSCKHDTFWKLLKGFIKILYLSP